MRAVPSRNKKTIAVPMHPLLVAFAAGKGCQHRSHTTQAEAAILSRAHCCLSPGVARIIGAVSIARGPALTVYSEGGCCLGLEQPAFLADCPLQTSNVATVTASRRQPSLRRVANSTGHASLRRALSRMAWRFSSVQLCSASACTAAWPAVYFCVPHAVRAAATPPLAGACGPTNLSPSAIPCRAERGNLSQHARAVLRAALQRAHSAGAFRPLAACSRGG